MNLDKYRTFFVVGNLVLILAAAFPGLSVFVSFPMGGERFSELWLLDPELRAEGYPFNTTEGELQGPVYVGVRNHMGCSQHYLVYAKFRNMTQPLPNSTLSRPSPMPPLFEFRFFLEDGAVWEAPITFEVLNMSLQNGVLVVGNILINGVDFSVDNISTWNSDYGGFFYQLFLELWLYDGTAQSFHYNNRFVGILLNMITPH
ncbi:MAG: DUF1616 domain-containing protein [Candidatus Bathyarchaeota archaeon]|nr:MAG: DUF1616 domain-containing protein [Candidatus Bathyarchaeota archaeon]